MAPPALAERAARVSAAFRVTDRVNPPMNLVISNVPGPRQPLYLRGAKMSHYIPVNTITDGVGLSITVQSYCDTLDFGLVADWQLVPDLWSLCDLCVDEIEVALGLGHRVVDERDALERIGEMCRELAEQPRHPVRPDLFLGAGTDRDGNHPDQRVVGQLVAGIEIVAQCSGA